MREASRRKREKTPRNQFRLAIVPAGLLFSGHAAGLTNAAGQVLFDPFGYPPYQGDPPERPHKLTEVQSVRSLSDVWLMVDADRVAFATAGWVAELPPKPAHGKVRNYVFFDGHVATKKTGAKSAY